MKRTSRQQSQDSNRKSLLKKAHKMTRELVKEDNTLDYRTQLTICIRFLCEEKRIKKELTIEQIRIQKQINESGLEAYDASRLWEKGGHSRLYIIIRGYKNGRIEKEIEFGYLDNNTLEYVYEDKNKRFENIYAA